MDCSKLSSNDDRKTAYLDEYGYPLSILEHLRRISREKQPCTVGDDNDSNTVWSDRVALQSLWTLPEKGWKVAVEWRESSTLHGGVGVFAVEAITAGTVLRVGKLGRNLLQFTSATDIGAFCQDVGGNDASERLCYVQDYLWGFYSDNETTDERGYAQLPQRISNDNSNASPGTPTFEDCRFYGMWLPGNGLNHSPIPNTVYRAIYSEEYEGIELVSLSDIASGQELFDDYRRHGTAPPWLREFAQGHGLSLNFSDCNSFVGVADENE